MSGVFDIESGQGSDETAPIPRETSLVPVPTLSNRGRKPERTVSISMGKGLIPKYEREKIDGTRRSNGARKLKRLSMRHLRILEMHLCGLSGEEISNAIGCTVVSVSRILNDPICQALIKRTYSDRQGELDALAGKAIDAVRSLLTNGSGSEQLAAVDKFVKLKGIIAPESNPMESAEDFAAAIVAQAGSTVNIQIIK